MKYQDELEAGRRSRKPEFSIAEQVEQYRRKQLRKVTIITTVISHKSQYGAVLYLSHHNFVELCLQYSSYTVIVIVKACCFKDMFILYGLVKYFAALCITNINNEVCSVNNNQTNHRSCYWKKINMCGKRKIDNLRLTVNIKLIQRYLIVDSG